MNGPPPNDAGRDGRGRSTSAASINYVRDGAVAAHKKMSAGLLTKLGLSTRTSPDPPSRASPLQTNEASTSLVATGHAEAAGKAAMSASPRKMTPPSSAAIITATTRNRKGSLRKNILQRGSLQRMETNLGPRAVSQMSDRTDSSGGSIISPTGPETDDDAEDDYPTPRVSYDKGSRTLSIMDGNRNYVTQEKLYLDSNLASASASLSQSNTLKDNSTTDEDERPPGSSSSNASSELMMATKKPPVVSVDSYFPPQPGTPNTRRRSPLRTRITKSSPLSGMPLDAASAAPLSPEVWDYAETEWWGWIILFVTWITFVVGMGSCFGAWSWAWDVGETPYAPPELEDDPTLPIVGYYPALIVLTGIMAWVWVVIAWVGMKYFKHAKMGGEDG